MELIKLECPECAGRLKKTTHKRLKCMHCGKNYKIEEFVDTEEIIESEEKLIISKIQKNNSAIAEFIKAFASFYLIILIMVIFVIAGMFAKDWIIGSVKDLWAMLEPKSTPLPYETGEFQIIPGKNLSINIWNSEEMTPMEIKFADIVEKLYQKDYYDMTVEDWGRVTSLIMKDGEDLIDVTAVLDGIEVHITCDRKAGEVSCGVSEVITFMWVFENLTVLDVGRCEIQKNDLRGLQKLTELHCGNDMNALVQMMSNPEEVTKLIGVEISKETEAIECFKNLRVLECEVYDCEDISVLGKFTHLEEIDMMVRNDKLKNFNVLGELTELRYISIDADGLYSIDFLKSLEKLEILKLEGGEYRSIEVLKELPKLKELTLRFHNLKDLSVLDELTDLEKIDVD